MIVPYSRYLSFIVNGLGNSYRDNLYRIKEDLEFTFSEYVLSQMHLAIVCHLLERDLYVVHRVYRFFEESREVSREDMLAVLRWYYRDMSGFLRTVVGCNLLKGILVKIKVPYDVFTSLGIEAEELSFEAEKKEVLKALKTGEGKYEPCLKLSYKDFKDCYDLDKLFETEEQENRYALAVILLYFSEQDKFIRWCNDDSSTGTIG